MYTATDFSHVIAIVLMILSEQLQTLFALAAVLYRAAASQHPGQQEACLC
jgi:hypothetical protein